MNLLMSLQSEMSNTQFSRIITLWWQMTRWLFRGWSVPGASPQLRLRHHPHIRRVIAKRWWWYYVIWWCLVVIWGSIRWHGWSFCCYLRAVWNSWNLPSAGDSEVCIVFQGSPEEHPQSLFIWEKPVIGVSLIRFDHKINPLVHTLQSPLHTFKDSS